MSSDPFYKRCHQELVSRLSGVVSDVDKLPDAMEIMEMAAGARRRWVDHTKRHSDEVDHILSVQAIALIFVEKMIRGNYRCAMCDFELDRQVKLDRPSADRIDNAERAYSAENTNITCAFCNMGRATASIWEWKVFLHVLFASPEDQKHCSREWILSKLGRDDVVDFAEFVNSRWRFQRGEMCKKAVLTKMRCTWSQVPFICFVDKSPFQPSPDRIFNHDKRHSTENTVPVALGVNLGRNSFAQYDFMRWLMRRRVEYGAMQKQYI